MKTVQSKTANFKHFNLVTHLILIAFLSIFTVSCSSNDDGPPPVIIKEIPQDIKDLIVFKGKEKASTVLIIEQGGPAPQLSEGVVDLIIENFNTTDILTVNVHQAQTLNPSILTGSDITLNQAVGFNAKSVETLSKVITNFKNEGRTVYVLGISFGAFITQELIAKKGIESADKYLIISGRLDMNNVFWKGLSEGKIGFFEDGVTPVMSPERQADTYGRNEAKLFAGLIMNRYTQHFKSIESLSNLTYIYGTTDADVGSLTDEEVAFLKSKNANILSGSGGHDEPFEGFYKKGFKDAFGIEPLQ